MSKASEIIEELKTEFSRVGELTASGIKRAFRERMAMFNIDDADVTDVEIDLEGEIRVTFVDEENDMMTVIFFVDDEDDSIIALVDDDDLRGLDDDEVIVIDLTPLNPPIKKMAGYPDYVNLSDLEWVNKSTLMSILRAGDIGVDASDPDGKPIANRNVDAKGNPLNTVGMQYGDLAPVESMLEDYGIEFDELELDEQGFARVVRGGKVVKLPLVRRKRRRILTGKQRQALRKAAMARKAKKGQISRKRKRSLQIRKSRGVKRRTGNTARFKVRGGADRKR